MQHKDNTSRKFSSFLAAVLLWFAAGKKQPANIAKSMHKDLSTGISRRKIRFNDRIRDAFRHRWLKLHTDD